MFNPSRILFEKEALSYKKGERLWQKFAGEEKDMQVIGSHNRVTGLPGKTPAGKFREAKETLVVGVYRSKKFATCRPSADYQLVLSTSCPGMCEYCYLHTTLGRRPVVRLYVNTAEILERAEKVIANRKPVITTFEGAATSDPLAVEEYSGSLAEAITFFAGQEYGRFRFVTKFTNVDPLLSLKHNERTEIRFSVNTEEIIGKFEHRTPPLESRLKAAGKVIKAGYPSGFLIAPVIIYPGWRADYSALLEQLAADLPEKAAPGLEIITHRFTARAKKNIQHIFPGSKLPLVEEERRFKFGQFGYGKYVYPQSEMEKITDFFNNKVKEKIPSARIVYIV